MCGNGTDYNLIALGLKSIYQMDRQLAKSIDQWEQYLEDKGENALAEELADISNTLLEAGINLNKIIKHLHASADHGHLHHHHHSHDHNHDHDHGHNHDHHHHHSGQKEKGSNFSNVDVTIVPGKDK